MDRRQFLKLASGAMLGPGVSRVLDRDLESALARGLAGNVAQQSTARPNYGPNPAPGTGPAPVTRKLLVLTFNPVLHSRGGVRMDRHLGWNDPDWLVRNHIRDLHHASFGYANYEIVENVHLNNFADFPLKANGAPFSEEAYLAAWPTKSFDPPVDSIHYHDMMSRFRIFERINNGEIDEVWTNAPPYVGRWEAVMVGPGASNSNAPPIGTGQVSRRFVIMGYTFDRRLTEMLHSYGHRAEGHLSTAHRNVPERDNLWRRFLRREHVTPGMAELGNVHFPPNAVRDYDYSNPGAVQCNADDWYHYPYLTGERFRAMSSSEWSSDDRLYFLWWYRHMPHLAGDCDGIAHNWWRYIVDPNTF